jgi:hypothetical protein|tara:strand:- start:350 stop:841 length:492 start_codon:yes stop_codon:yes gene_type:complete
VHFRPWGKEATQLYPLKPFKYWTDTPTSNNTDAAFDAKYTSAKATFAGACANAVIASQKKDDAGIHVIYTNAASKCESDVITAFTEMYIQLGESGMCGWTRENFPYRCERERSYTVLQAMSLSFGIVSLFLMVILQIVPFVTRVFCCRGDEEDTTAGRPPPRK